jgi:hypothetical protein
MSASALDSSLPTMLTMPGRSERSMWLPISPVQAHPKGAR